MNRYTKSPDLEPQIIVMNSVRSTISSDKFFPRENLPKNFVVYQDDKIRVLKLYNIAASPYQGQWVIRIDILAEEDSFNSNSTGGLHE